MKILIGLGNPGLKYEKTRHNAGFIFVDYICDKLNFPEFKLEKKFNAEISEGMLNEEKTFLIKPQTFMNLSGQSISSILNFYKISPSDITIVHDDLDIEIGNFKISKDSRAAGHNGVQSIFDQLGTQEVRRIRIGVEKTGGRTNRIEPGDEFVLKDFSKEESEKLSSIFEIIIKELS